MGNEKESLQFLQSLLFVKIFRTFRMAIQPSKLIIAFCAIAIICLAGWLMDFSRSVVLSSDTHGTTTELEVYMLNPNLVKSFIEETGETQARKGVFATLWSFAASKLHTSIDSLFEFNIKGMASNIADYFRAVLWAVRYHFLYCIIFFAITLAVISAAGGAICRIASLQFARGEKPGMIEALRFSLKRFSSFFAAPLVPIGIIIFIGLFIFILGLLGNIPWAGELIIGIFMPLALVGGALIALILIGAIAGFNLMFPAVAYEASDCFDAISRSFSYVYTKPWRMGFYMTIAAGYGTICYLFVRFFAFLLLFATRLFVSFGVLVENRYGINKLSAIWSEPTFSSLLGASDLQSANWTQWLAGFLVHLSSLVVVGLVVSFIISFYFSANTIIYAALRNRVDNTALEEVYTHADETPTEPTLT
ncbi:MAG: hypothetical protein ACYSSL_00665 [Planctomycetota bacterium]|jgi:hypothetical protein